jgi:hypothetical protein
MNEIQELINLEIKLINSMLISHGIQARTLKRLTLCVKSSFIAYGLQVAQGESVRKIEAIQRELSNALTNQRLRHLPDYNRRVMVRLRDFPLAIEVPHPAPSILAWTDASLHMGPNLALVGRSYSAAGPREEHLDLERHYHVLIAAMSGGGKSTLMRMALLTLAYNTPPSDLRVVLIDMKNDDLAPFRALPHVVRYAGDPTSAAEAIAYIHEVKTERIESQVKPYRLLVVIDELAELGTDKATLRQLGSILSTGRSLGINTWAGTQYPSAAAIGSIVAASFTTRLVGIVDGKNTAHVATKRAGSGAENLCTPGDFLRVDGPDLVRMKGYCISQDETAALLPRVVRRWHGQSAEVQPQPAPVAAIRPYDEVEELARNIADLWRAGASKNAMSKATLGKSYAGSYATKIDAAIAWLEVRASTTEASTTPSTASTHTSTSGVAVSSSRSDRKIIRMFPSAAVGS